MAKICLLPLVVLAIFARGCSAQGLSLDRTTVNEDEGTVTLTVTPLDIFGSPWLMTYETLDGTAIAGVDYTPIPTSVTDVKISSEPSVDITVDIIDVPGYQGDRDFVISFTGGTNLGPLVFPIDITITIVDDDILPVVLSATTNSPVTEGGNLTVTLSRADGTDYPFNATVTTVAGTATAGVDFWELSAVQFTFEQDETSKDIIIPIVDDDEAEPSEWFNVTIGGPDVDTELVEEIELKDNDTPVLFHCGRNGQDCMLQNQCQLTGECEGCEAGYNGADCMDFTANITADCDPECVNGTCFDGVCKCDPGFAGPACDEKAYFHQCNPTNFSVCITPFGDFMGHVYVIGYDNVTECNLTVVSAPVPDGVPEWCEGHGGVIEFDGACGTLGPIAEGTRTKFEVVLKVQYSPPNLRATDEIVTFVCSYENDSISVSNPTGLSVQPPNPDTQGTPNGGTIDFSPAIQTVRLNNGDPLPAMLELNTLIKVCLTVDGVAGYDAVVIRKIILDNKREAPNDMTTVAYVGGCGQNSILFRDPAFDPVGSTHTMCYSFASFILDPTDPEPKMGITTEVEVYGNAADPEAVLDVCGARKKRAVTSSGGTVVSGYSETVVLLTPQGDSGTPNGGDTLVEEPALTETECVKEGLLPALIGLGVVAITMAIIIAILGCTVIRQFRAKRFD